MGRPDHRGVNSTDDAEWTLRLRVPRWSTEATLTEPDGTRRPVEPGYASITRRWVAGETVVLDLPLAIRLTAAPPRVDAVRGCRAIERGPLVYAVEQVDQPAGLPVDDLLRTPADPDLFTAEARPELLGGCVVVHGPARLPDGRSELFTAVPYCLLWANREVGPMRVWLPSPGDHMIRRRTVSKARLGTALAGIALLISGCAGAGTLPPPSLTGAGFGIQATGTVQLWVRAATQAASQPIVDSFNKTHSKIKVVLTAIPDTQYITKLSTAIRGRSVPDVVDIDDINSTLLAYHDALTDITSLAHALPYLNQLSPGHLKLATYQDRIYAVPFAGDISVLYYNKALFRQAGLDPGKPPTKLGQVLTDARAITKLGNGIKGISFGGDSPGIMGFTGLPSMWASKSYLFQGPLGHQTAHISDNPALRALLRVLPERLDRGVSQPTSRTETGTTWGQDFLAGKVGIWPGNEGALAAKMTPALAKDIAAVPLPGALHGTSVFVGGDNIGIPRGAKNASGAWEYIQFALQAAQQQSLPKAGYTPIRSDVNTPQFRAQYPRTAVALQALSSGYAEKTLAYNTAVNQVSGPWFSMFTSAVFGSGVDAAIRKGQSGFARAFTQAQS